MGCCASLVCKTIPDGQHYAVSTRGGKVDVISGPRMLCRCGRFFKEADWFAAAANEYLVIKFRDGRTEFRAGPASSVQHPVDHEEIKICKMTQLKEGDCLAVYRESEAGSQGKVQRTLLQGPCMYMPKSASEWTQKIQKLVASEGEYLEVTHLDGNIEFTPGPASLVVDPEKYTSVEIKSAVRIGDQEIIVVYRKTPSASTQPLGGTAEVQRHLIQGPRIYIPESPSEWTHQFCWTGNAETGSEKGWDTASRARKKTNALKFEKLRTSPGKMYYDVESVRTKDNASITVRLMLFFSYSSIEKMLDSSNDPFGDMINAVTADVIEWCAPKTFDEFLASTDRLNTLDVYIQLKSQVLSIGMEIQKVVFRGYEAPAKLQAMHDDAIEKRTKLALARESEEEEQKLADFKLEKEIERSAREHKLTAEKLEHELAMEARSFEEKQRQKQDEINIEIDKLKAYKSVDWFSTFDTTSYLLATHTPVVAPTIQCATLQTSIKNTL
eukprot:TRINITY_DN41368_c0_g1_i1.p1 TRINITY_DN41368_c0_g1~~TRINITY_DN41368_c0_g1_i1.p1  ORF type:complete len:497 (-),score=91.83 TRINITY_DN41368_c0_g1_i1:302-1792(-)